MKFFINLISMLLLLTFDGWMWVENLILLIKKTPGVLKEAAIQKCSLIYVVLKSRHILEKSEAVVQSCFVKKVFLEVSQNSQKNTCARVSFFCNFTKKETLAQVFSCELCEISENTFSYRTPWWLLLKIEKVILVALLRFFRKTFFKESLHIMAKLFKLW